MVRRFARAKTICKVGSHTKAVSYSDTEELPNIFMEPEIHCRLHKIPSLSQIDTVHPTLLYLHFNIIQRPTSCYSKWWNNEIIHIKISIKREGREVSS